LEDDASIAERRGTYTFDDQAPEAVSDEDEGAMELI